MPGTGVHNQRNPHFVYKLAYGFTRSHDNALDLSQIVFLKVYRRVSLFRGEASFRTWLAKVVYHEGINWQRANRRHAQGRETTPAPHWPNMTLAQRGSCIGCEREGGREERYSLLLRGLDTQTECDHKQEVWSRASVGDAWAGKSGVVFSEVRCDSLSPVVAMP